MIFTVTLNPAVDRELTVDDIVFDTVLRASEWQVDCGGKGFNVGRMLKSLVLRVLRSVLRRVKVENCFRVYWKDWELKPSSSG